MRLYFLLIASERFNLDILVTHVYNLRKFRKFYCMIECFVLLKSKKIQKE